MKRDLWSWSSNDELWGLIQRYFSEAHGTTDIDYAEWRYGKWEAVMVYVSRNMHAFDTGDLAVAGSERAVTHGKLFHPIFDYAIEHDITDPDAFPEPSCFHDPAA